VCYTGFGAYPNHIYITIIVEKQLVKKRKKEEKEKIKQKNTTAQIGTNVWARGFGAGLLARSRFAPERSCNRSTRSRFSVAKKEKSNCQTRKLKCAGTKTNWPTDRLSQYNLKLNLRHCTANYRPVLSSERAPHINRPATV
jgi:hypothetical protein